MAFPSRRETLTLANARAMGGNGPAFLVETARTLGPVFRAGPQGREAKGRRNLRGFRRPAGAIRAPHNVLRLATMKTILIVEDHADIRTSLQELLQWSGHVVHTASNGTEGVSKFQAHQPQVALVNLGLPGIDGYEVARQVRQSPGGDAVYMVAVTGWTGDGIKSRAMDAGFDQHVTKPFDVEQLMNLVISGRRAPVEVA